MIAGSGKRGMNRGRTKRAPTTATKTIVTPSIGPDCAPVAAGARDSRVHAMSPSRVPRGPEQAQCSACIDSGHVCSIGFLGVVLGGGLSPPRRTRQAPTKMTLAGTSAYAGQSTTLRVELTDASGNPLGRRAGDRRATGRRRLGSSSTVDTTNANGRASVAAELSKRSGRATSSARGTTVGPADPSTLRSR